MSDRQFSTSEGATMQRSGGTLARPVHGSDDTARLHTVITANKSLSGSHSHTQSLQEITEHDQGAGYGTNTAMKTEPETNIPFSAVPTR
ncbi:hypothetical protein DPEC_G00291380 [Dallia pectoralis]|uniref:Uncharacterized protein n=1 Tax=Dallia pectoralis TaxID=75939 RepID=A0ACC2FHM6_DALPE|nr:hypothetical protein DPEC_G00291380 [Dallia pectoralis]